MTWKSSARTVAYWGCSNTERAYHNCLIDTYHNSIIHPKEVRVLMRSWSKTFNKYPCLYLKFRYQNEEIKIWKKVF